MSTSLLFSDVQVEVDNYHNDFLILRSADPAVLTRLGKALHLRQFEFADEVIVTKAEVLLKLNALFSPDHLPLLSQLNLPPTSAFTTFQLPVLFGQTPDWDTFLAETQMDAKEAIERLCGQSYLVAMLGFLPGFVYLDGLDQDLHLPRKSVPAKYVEAGAVAIGGKYLGVYGLDSPGGWHVIGNTPLQLLEVPILPPVPFFPGDQFQLQAIDRSTYDALRVKSLTLSAYNAHS